MGRPAASAEVQPSGRSAFRVQVVHGPRPGSPAPAGLRPGVVELVEHTPAAIHHQHVTITLGVRPALDGRTCGDRIRSRVALVSVIETYCHAGLAARHRGIGDADGTAGPPAGAKIGVQRRVGADGIDVGGRVGV